MAAAHPIRRARALAGLAARRAAHEARRLPRRARKARRRLARLPERRFRGTYATSLARVPSREELPHVLNRRGLVGVGAEIGVKKAGFSERLLRAWRGRKLISVDPWLAAPDEDYVDRANVDQARHDAFYRVAQRRLARFGERSEIWRTTSLEAAARIPDASLDFVYVDARHDHASVLADLEAWFPKVRPGGLVAGDDYVDGTFPNGVFGVRSAVDAFFGARDLPVHATHEPPSRRFPSWLVALPPDYGRAASAAASAPGSRASASA